MTSTPVASSSLDTASSASDAAGAGDLPAEIFKLIVDHTANPFVVVAPDGQIRYAGGSIERVVGWRAADIAGRNIVDFLPADQVEVAIEAMSEIEHVDRHGDGVPMVFQIQRADESLAWVEIGAIPLLDVPGVDDLVVLRLRPWGEQYWFDRSIAALLADEPLDDVLAALCRSIAAALEADGAVVHYRFDGAAFSGAAGCGLAPEDLPLDVGPWCDAASSGSTAITHVDPATLPCFVAAPSAALGLRACWTVAVPLSPGLAPAVVSVWRRAEGAPLIGHRHVLDRSARYVQLALVRAVEHDRLRHLAGHDALTGVANRAEFRNRLAQALAIGERDVAVAFCDLDDFKPVNDRYGHHVGDDVLIEVASRLRTSLRAGDELARVGGDEFTVLLHDVPDEAAALHVADRLLSAFDAPFDVEGAKADIGLSVGIALAEPGITADELVARADESLYTVKRAGGRGVHITVRSGDDGPDRDATDDRRDPRLPA